MDRIRAVGVGVPGRVERETGMVELAPDLGWENVPLGRDLERRLAIPSFIANVHALGTLGIYTQEAKAAPRRFAALFLGPQIGGGLILDGKLHDLAELPVRPPLFEAPRLNLFSTLPGSEFRHFRGRDFRKALRKGNPAVARFIQEIAFRTGQIAAQLVGQFAPEVIAIGGSILDETREEILRTIESSARKELGADRSLHATFLPSGLGDLAGITGAAVWAAEHSTQPDKILSAQYTPA